GSREPFLGKREYRDLHRPGAPFAEYVVLLERRVPRPALAVRVPRQTYLGHPATLDPGLGPVLELALGCALERPNEIAPVGRAVGAVLDEPSDRGAECVLPDEELRLAQHRGRLAVDDVPVHGF